MKIRKISLTIQKIIKIKKNFIMKKLIFLICIFAFSCKHRNVLEESMNGVWYEVINTEYHLNETIYDIRSLAETSRYENNQSIIVSIDTVIFRYTIENESITSIRSFRDVSVYEEMMKNKKWIVN